MTRTVNFIIGSDNGLSPGRRQAIIWTNAIMIFTVYFVKQVTLRNMGFLHWQMTRKCMTKDAQKQVCFIINFLKISSGLILFFWNTV